MQVLNDTVTALDKMDACAGGCWLWPSITQRSYQTAEILGASFGLPRSRITPEYSFLDSRQASAQAHILALRLTSQPSLHLLSLMSPVRNRHCTVCCIVACAREPGT